MSERILGERLQAHPWIQEVVQMPPKPGTTHESQCNWRCMSSFMNWLTFGYTRHGDEGRGRERSPVTHLWVTYSSNIAGDDLKKVVDTLLNVDGFFPLGAMDSAWRWKIVPKECVFQS